MKTKSIFTALSCIVLFCACKKPPMVSPGTDVPGTTVYVLGTDSGHNFVYWKNGVAASVPTTLAVNGGGAFFVSGNNVYAAGSTKFLSATVAPQMLNLEERRRYNIACGNRLRFCKRYFCLAQ